MPVQATQMYNDGYNILITDGLANGGEFMWALVNNNYIPSLSDTDVTAFGVGNVIVGGAGAPIDADNVSITSTPGNANESYFRAGSGTVAGRVRFGPDVIDGDMVYRYLVLVRPAVASTWVYDATTKLIFYIDLIGGNTNDITSIGDYVTINMAGNGWLKMVQS